MCIRDRLKKEIVTRLALLPASPMAHVDDEDSDCNKDDEKAEKIKSNAEMHLAFFRDNFELFCQNFDKCCVCVISDNCNRNKKIGSNSNFHMIGCYSHKLNLEVKKMIADVPEMHRAVQKVHMTIKAARKTE